MSLIGLTGLALGAGLGTAVVLLVATLSGWTPGAGRHGPLATHTDHPLWGSEVRRRALYALGVAVLVAVLTRWPVAVVAAGAGIFLWPTMFGGGKIAAGQIERVEALATWTESLRDSIAGSIGLEEAIRHSLTAAPPALQPGLERLTGRLRIQIPMPQALAGFAEEFEDSSADLVIAALILNSQLRGPGLVVTLTALATAAREEIDMRRRIEEGRKALRRTALIIIGATVVFAGGLAVFSRTYVAPYSTPAGQVMLALVLSVFAAGLVWIRSAANVRPPERFLVGVDQIDRALTVASPMQTARALRPTSATAVPSAGIGGDQ